jgi:hypothetical protein
MYHLNYSHNNELSCALLWVKTLTVVRLIRVDHVVVFLQQMRATNGGGTCTERNKSHKYYVFLPQSFCPNSVALSYKLAMYFLRAV